YQDGPMLIPSVARALGEGRRIALTAGEHTRDFVYVDDVAAALVAALGAPDGVYNIATGIETRVRDAVELLASHFPGSNLRGFGERPPRPDEPRRYVLDVSRAASVLGWRASTSLADGLAATSSRYRPTSRDLGR